MRDKNGRFMKKPETAVMERLPEKWFLSVDKLTMDQKNVVSDYFVKQSGQECYRTLRVFVVLSSHNKRGESIVKGMTIAPLESTFDNYFKDHIEITFEQFRKYVLKEEDEFVLPNEWCLAVTPHTKPMIEEWRTDGKIRTPGGYVLSEGHSKAHTGKRGYYVYKKPKGTPEITFEEFKKYVLNQKETMKTDKKLVGYNFKSSMKQYEPAALAIARIPNWNASWNCNVTAGSTVAEYLKKAAVLDMWFEPVYEDDIPQVEIRGYKAVFNGGPKVTFGCQVFTQEEVLKFVEILDRSGLNLAQYEPEVRKVANYLKRK